MLDLVPVHNSSGLRPPECRCSLPASSPPSGEFELLTQQFDWLLLLLLRHARYDFEIRFLRSMSEGQTHLLLQIKFQMMNQK